MTKEKLMECNNTLCRHNGVTEKICCCKNPETFCKYLEAKKLLKQFLEAKNGEDTYKAEWEAEQFLKDSEADK